jgi:valyl-tRNA synthetase
LNVEARNDNIPFAKEFSIYNFKFSMLDKAYDAKKYEDEIYKKWEESGAFVANNKSDKPPFTISMPPPNATGVLHLGHSVMLALEDIMARHKRMKGYEVLYLPGTDHAAIATESVVIKMVKEKEGIENPRSLGRETLVGKIADFVAGSQNTIRSQIRKMGTSCDWSREAYTMDPSLNRCVNEVFKKMYDDGLIYRAKRVVNWDVALQTTLADDEVEHKEQEGTLYTFEYLSAEQTGGEPIYVSTSRPETKLGDTALAVHPDDERYQHLVGRDFDITWPSGQTINVTVIADHDVDKDFGSGVVGVTPFHSKIDYDLWMRHRDEIKADPIHVINEQGRITESIKGFEGLSVFQAREKMVSELREAGLLTEEKKYMQQTAISYRSKKAVEPLPKLQWFIDVNKKLKIEDLKLKIPQKEASLKEIMQEVVNSGQINIIPSRFSKIYFHWVNNLQDWCVSRQIWWGHRIPVWYCVQHDKVYVSLSEAQIDRGLDEQNKYLGGDARLIKNYEEYEDKNTKLACNPVVSIQKPESCPHCGSKELLQDEDTLDTWFSSALWTWSTLVNKEKTDDLSLSLKDILAASPDFQKFHPTSVMETGYDIIFFWVARMILMTTYATGQVPFETVYLHGLIRTREGKKMSKSDPKTCIDPLDMIDKYGADALRMSMVIGNTPGNDMRLYEEKIKGYRNFTNKLWNASRFVIGIFEEQGIKEAPAIDFERLSDADEWVLSKLNNVIKATNEALDQYRISDAGQLLYDCLWNDFCDWYLELSKGGKQNTAVLHYVLTAILKLLHPITPFVTEALWAELPGTHGLLISESYPMELEGDFKQEGISDLINVISSIRSMRSENGIEASAKVPVTLYGHDKTEMLKRNQDDIIRLARVSELSLWESGEKLSNTAADVASNVEIFIPLDGLVDTEKERERLEKEVANLEKYVASISGKLSNKNFVQNAPEAVVAGERAKLEEAESKLGKMKEQLGNL